MASSPLDVIKQYLVSLGFEVDKSSYDSATKAIDSVKTGLSSFAGDTVKQFGLATAAVTTFVTTAIVGMSKFLNDLGNAQIRYEMLARQMWTTKENAEAFSTTLKAMGTTLDQLYLSPTLMQQFQQLHQQAFQMMPPAEFQQQMSFIQSITFEFKRMKLEGTYALQWIGYYFIKYMSGPITNIKNTLSNVNDIIIKTMPYWTKVVAEVMSWFAQFGVTTVEAIKDVAKIFNDIGESIPKNIKLIGLALSGLLIIMNQGPIGWIIDAIVALGLAVNDFFTYIHGGQSEFGPFWQKLIDLYNKLKDTGEIDKFKDAFKTALKDISKDINDAITGIGNLYTTLQNNGTIDNFKKTFVNAYGSIKGAINDVIKESKKLKINLGNDLTDLLQSVSHLADAFTGLFNTILNANNKGPNDVTMFLTTLDTLIKQLASGINALADLFQGNWKDMWKNLGDIFTKDTSSMSKNYLYPQSSNKQTNNNSHVTVNNTQNIYGSSDPNATATAASNNLTTVLRNTKGVIV